MKTFFIDSAIVIRRIKRRQVQKSFGEYNWLISIAIVLCAVFAAWSLVACGGGGSGSGSGGSTSPGTGVAQVVSGVAATGAAMTGTVSLKDANGVVLGPKPINPDGSFLFDVAGLTPPFYLRAEDANCAAGNPNCRRLYSVAMGAGTANINPLTDLAVALASGANDPAAAYNNPEGYPIAEDILNNVINAIQSRLFALLNNYDDEANDAHINFLTDNFKANHRGLDAFFDEVNVRLDTLSGTVTFSVNSIELTENLSNLATQQPVILISGSGFNNSGASLSLNVNSSSSGVLVYYEPLKRLDFQSTSITGVSLIGDTAIITGDGIVNEIGGYTFMAMVTDGSPDAIGIKLHYNAPSQSIMNGNYSVGGTSASGSGLNNSGASLSLFVNSSSLGSSWLNYFDPLKRLDFSSMTITGISLTGGNATITGGGSVNNVSGYTVTATVTDSSPDSMGIEFSYNSTSQPIINGNYSIIPE